MAVQEYKKESKKEWIRIHDNCYYEKVIGKQLYRCTNIRVGCGECEFKNGIVTLTKEHTSRRCNAFGLELGQISRNEMYSIPLQNILKNEKLTQECENKLRKLEELMYQESKSKPSKREFYNYIYFDMRNITNTEMSKISFEIFLERVFYVGKGKSNRIRDHLKEALEYAEKFTIQTSFGEEEKIRKLEKIIDIWNSGDGPIIMRYFNGSTWNESIAREGSMIDAMGKFALTNIDRGWTKCEWNDEGKETYGSYLLFKMYEHFIRLSSRKIVRYTKEETLKLFSKKEKSIQNDRDLTTQNQNIDEFSKYFAKASILK